MDLIKIDNKEFKDIFNVDVTSNVDIYILKMSNIIGYGLIRDTKENPLSFYIKEEYRGNGYGTKLFNALIDIIRKTTKYKDISLTINKLDICTNNIIKNNGGVEVLEEKDKISYIIPL